MKKSKIMAYLFAGLAIIIIGVIVILLMTSKSSEKPLIRIAQIEMREYDISSKIPGRVEWIAVDEGDKVEIGTQLFKLTDREVKAKLAQAGGAVESAKAQLNMLIAGARQEEIDMARRAFEAAKSQFELAEKTFNRMKSLHNDKLISDQEFDVVFQKYSAAKAAMEASKSQLDLAIKGARNEQKDMARGQLDRAVQSQEEAKAYLDESIIYSPISGFVAKRLIDQGEMAATGYPVLTLIDPNDVWAELNLPANELEKIKIGDVLEGRVHGAGIIVKFKVTNFAVMGDFANWRSTNDKNTFDVRSFTVKLKPINANTNSLRPGMTVSIDLNQIKK